MIYIHYNILMNSYIVSGSLALLAILIFIYRTILNKPSQAQNIASLRRHIQKMSDKKLLNYYAMITSKKNTILKSDINIRELNIEIVKDELANRGLDV